MTPFAKRPFLPTRARVSLYYSITRRTTLVSEVYVNKTELRGQHGTTHHYHTTARVHSLASYVYISIQVIPPLVILRHSSTLIGWRCPKPIPASSLAPAGCFTMPLTSSLPQVQFCLECSIHSTKGSVWWNVYLIFPKTNFTWSQSWQPLGRAQAMALIWGLLPQNTSPRSSYRMSYFPCSF